MAINEQKKKENRKRFSPQMGYAELGQSGAGIHLRQYSRAFIFQKGDTRIVLVTADIHSVAIAIRRQVSTLTLTM